MMPAAIRNVVSRFTRGLQPEEGIILPLTIIGVAVGSVLVIGMLSFTGTVVKIGGDDQDQTIAVYAARAGIVSVVSDLIEGDDALDPTYEVPTTTVSELPLSITVSSPASSTRAESVYQYIDPGVDFGVESLSSQESYYFTIENVLEGSKLRANWAFTPNGERWKMRLYEGGGPPSAPTSTVLASDDFESGGFSGGTGWSFDWTTSASNADVVTSTAPRDAYHLRLSAGDGTASRALDTSTTTDVRIKFWAKGCRL